MFPRIEMEFTPVKNKKRPNETVLVTDFIGVKGFKAKGKRLTEFPVDKIIPLDPLPYEEPKIETVIDENIDGTEEEIPSEELIVEKKAKPAKVNKKTTIVEAPEKVATVDKTAKSAVEQPKENKIKKASSPEDPDEAKQMTLF
jgi:hypothetical protein